MKFNSKRLCNDMRYRFDEINVLSDESVCMVRYNKPCVEGDVLEMSLEKNWRGEHTGNYRLEVKIPPQRVLEAIVLVMRTSVNSYTVVISKSGGTTIEKFTTMDEIISAVLAVSKS